MKLLAVHLDGFLEKNCLREQSSIFQMDAAIDMVPSARATPTQCTTVHNPRPNHDKNNMPDKTMGF